MSRASPETWTTRRLLAWMTEAFAAKGLDSPRLSAEVLLAHVIGCDRLRLYMDVDRPASEIERGALRDLVQRANNHEPVQYLTGEAWFFGMRLKVDQRVLIPRPATETIVEAVLHHCKSRPGFGGKTGEGALIADIGTGSGAVALALAKHLPGARLVATDISADALRVARENAERLEMTDRIEFIEGDLLTALSAHPSAGQEGELSFLVSNPPYIPDDEWDAVEPNVREHEPTLALRGGMDGLALVRPLLTDGPALVRHGGLVLVELAASRADEAATLAKAAHPSSRVELLRDLEGHDRVIRIDVTRTGSSRPA
ncbi:MAG: peptide chain release factor N(5)-glutamine methyltransferase [Planctomycetota bacterium]